MIGRKNRLVTRCGISNGSLYIKRPCHIIYSTATDCKPRGAFYDDTFKESSTGSIAYIRHKRRKRRIGNKYINGIIRYTAAPVSWFFPSYILCTVPGTTPAYRNR